MTGHYIFTCPACRAIVDYGCICAEPQPSDQWEGHDTVESAKARVDDMHGEAA